MSKKKRIKKGSASKSAKESLAKSTSAKVTSAESTSAKVVKTKKAQVLEPTRARAMSKTTTNNSSVPLLFGKKNFMFIFIGMGCMALGMLLMSGGSMPSPDIWDESIIYGFRRITLAPIMILLGLGFVLYSIFVPNTANA